MAYKTSVFNEDKTPAKPIYSNIKSWAAMPGSYPQTLIDITGEHSEKKADVFYVYPTLFSDRENPAWNADIYDPNFRKEIS